MKVLTKLLIVAVIVVPIILCFNAISNIWSQPGTGDIVFDNTTGDNTSVEDNTTGNQQVQDDINGVISETIDGEDFSNTIGNPTGKIVEKKVKVTTANVYLETNVESELIGTISKGTVVIAQDYPSGWTRVKNEEVTGWMKTNNLEAISEDAPDSSIGNPSGGTGTVNVKSVNVRKQATTSSGVVEILTEGTLVSIVSTSGDWYQIKWQNIEGYIHKDYIDIK